MCEPDEACWIVEQLPTLPCIRTDFSSLFYDAHANILVLLLGELWELVTTLLMMVSSMVCCGPA